MKTFEQVLQKAVSIADNDPNAVVAVFDIRIHQNLNDCKDWIGSGLLKLHTRQYISECGGKVHFFDAGQDVWPNVAGYVFTHVFCSGFVSRDDEQLIASRIRYKTEPYPEPAGFYDFDGIVTRTSTW
jgi:hypothetical protein